MGAKRRVALTAPTRAVSRAEFDRLRDRVDRLAEWAWGQHQLDIATCAMANTTKPPPPPPKFRRVTRVRVSPSRRG